MYRRVLAFDFDGTLAVKGDVPPEVETALGQCRASGLVTHYQFIPEALVTRLIETTIGPATPSFSTDSGALVRVALRTNATVVPGSRTQNTTTISGVEAPRPIFERRIRPWFF